MNFAETPSTYKDVASHIRMIMKSNIAEITNRIGSYDLIRNCLAAKDSLCRPIDPSRIEFQKSKITRKKRTNHTKDRGVRLHACILHNIVCKQLAEQGVFDKYNKCLSCGHAKKCRIWHCEKIAQKVSRDLDRRYLVPIACELDVASPDFHKKITTAIDLLCMNVKCKELTLVSIKTQGKNDTKSRNISYTNNDALKGDRNVFEQLIGKSMRLNDVFFHQSQLLLEFVLLSRALRDHYKLSDAMIIYVYDARRGENNRSSVVKDLYWRDLMMNKKSLLNATWKIAKVANHYAKQKYI